MRTIEMDKLFGKIFAKAIELECEKRDMTPIMFFASFIHSWADDEFFDYMMELCEKHHLEVGEEDWDDDEDIEIVRDFYREAFE